MQGEKTIVIKGSEIETVKGKTLTDIDRRTLTPEEERLLEVLLSPDSLGKNITEKCKAANISRQAYYDIMKRERFLDCLNKTAVDLIRDKIADVIAASVKVATGSGARGYQDRRMLLEMFGYDFRDNLEVKIKVINADTED